MSRPLRIEYPGAWYHIMNRGRRHENIFETTKDYQEFIKVLQEASSQFGLQVSAYCLMPNHYHLLVHTPHGNLSRGMRHVNGVYTQRFNKTHEYDGQLFRGRYKAVLVEDNEYLLQVMRYIHRNPLEAKVVGELKQFPWSSHHAYKSKAKKWQWVNKKALLEILTKKVTYQVKEYKHFIAEENSKEIDVFYSLGKLPSLLGGISFKKEIRERLGEKQFEQEVVKHKELAHSPETIIEAVCRFFSIDRKVIMTSRRGVSNYPRDIVIFLLKKYRRDTLTEIGSVLGIEHYSTVSNGINRVKKKIKRDTLFAKDIKNIEKSLNKVQKKT